VAEGDFATVFERLKDGLRTPLAGMGTAFSSSLFGLGGSMVLGFVDLQAGHAQNRFFNGLEEWLSEVTQFIDEPGNGDAEAGHLTTRLENSASLQILAAEMRAERLLMREILEQVRDLNRKEAE